MDRDRDPANVRQARRHIRGAGDELEWADRVREIDEVPEAVKPASTEAIEGEVDFEKITTLDHVRSLTADQWAKLRASDPGKAEALLRKASEAMTERAAEMRSGGLDLFEVAE